MPQALKTHFFLFCHKVVLKLWNNVSITEVILLLQEMTIVKVITYIFWSCAAILFKSSNFYLIVSI